MFDIYEATVNSIRGDLLRRKESIERSRVALRSQDTGFAALHLKAIKLYDSLLDTLRRETT